MAKNSAGERRMSELKECPFCGQKARMVSHDPDCGYTTDYRVECDGCGGWYGDPATATREWNQRATAQEAEGGEVVGIIDKHSVFNGVKTVRWVDGQTPPVGTKLYATEGGEDE